VRRGVAQTRRARLQPSAPGTNRIERRRGRRHAIAQPRRDCTIARIEHAERIANHLQLHRVRAARIPPSLDSHRARFKTIQSKTEYLQFMIDE
jgi:hypothetical protein